MTIQNPVPTVAALLTLLLAGLPARAQVDRETLEILGWAKACSVAVEYYGYPALGNAIFTEPISMQIGSISLVEPKREPVVKWLIHADGKSVWDADKARKAEEKLRKSGFVLKGSSETLPGQPTGWPGVDQVLLTTRSLGAYSPSGWPQEKDFRLHQIHYSPMGTCALLLYRWTGAANRDFFQFVLVRLRNPRAKVERALAYLDLANRLFESGDLDGALRASRLAASGAQRDAETRYKHAAYLALSGYRQEAIDELATALRYRRENRERARLDPDFEDLRKDKRFRLLTH
ncbi:MAG: hypothetical protein HY924_15910 [Elusimicrobia bacterium]|nr:hypothetical protein [Elusimicrobiota bacterium]